MQVTHWSFVVVTTYILCKNLENINFENELRIDLQPFLSHGMETLLGLLEIISESRMSVKILFLAPQQEDCSLPLSQHWREMPQFPALIVRMTACTWSILRQSEDEQRSWK